MTLRIDGDVLIPGRGEPIADGALIIEGARITYAGKRSDAPTSAGEVTEVPVLMPGLWEAHGHFIGMPGADIHVAFREPLAAMAARAAADAAATLDGGVTSVREVGGLGIDFAPAIDDGTLRGPTIYGAGRILSATGGHADAHAYPLDLVESAPGWLGELCDGVPACLRAVRKQLRRGAKVIKVCASGGVMSEIDHPIHQQFSAEELRAIVDEAGRAERSVAAHCHGKPGIIAALEAGCLTIEHGSYLDEEAAELMKQKGAILVPTRFVLSELLGMGDVLPPYAYEKGLAVAERHGEALSIAVAAGVTIAMGTDIFMGDGYGRNGREIRHLIEAGLTPLQAVEAATSTGPLTLGRQAPRSGQLREGYDADVIALDANPLDDISVWGDPGRVTRVWKAGSPVKQPD